LEYARTKFGVGKTVAAANSTLLDLELELREMKDGVRICLGSSGSPDLFVLRGEIGSAINIECTDDNVETVGEIKPPFSGLYHTSNRAGIDQLTYEVEALGQSLRSKPPITKGFITDLFAISVHVRVVVGEKIYHCVSNRVVNIVAYVKRLILICCCAITVDEMQEFFRDALEIAVSAEKCEPVNSLAMGTMATLGKHKAADAGENKPSGKRSCHQSYRKRAWEFEDENAAEDVHYLLTVDARIRGVTPLREIDFNTIH
jgi:hypothetical protein